MSTSEFRFLEVSNLMTSILWFLFAIIPFTRILKKVPAYLLTLKADFATVIIVRSGFYFAIVISNASSPLFICDDFYNHG